MKRTIIPILFGLILAISCSSPKIEVIATSCENRISPVGMPRNGFRLGWKMASSQRGVTQTAFQILLADNKNILKEGQAVWNSGKITSDQSVLVTYTGPELKSGTRYFWKVKVWDNYGNESAWSAVAGFITELGSPEDWQGAQWIAYDQLDSSKRIVPGIHLPGGNKDWKKVESGFHVLPLLRSNFEVKRKVKQALVFVCGLGHYDLHLNGQKVGNSILAPGWTDYDDYAFYNTYDITKELQPGTNAFGVMLGNGFFNIPNSRYRKLMTAYGNPQLILKLQMVYADGTEETIVSDNSWKVAPGPITYSSIYGGETYNALLEQAGWDEVDFDDANWQNALEVKSCVHELRPELDYPVEITQKLKVKTITPIESEDGYYLYDFGQNASGVITVSVQGQKGDTIYFYPAELKTEENRAEQSAMGRHFYFTYILKGDEVETWTPQFTYTGFRYVEVRGAHPASEQINSNLPEIIDLKLDHLHNVAPRLGHFKTSDELFCRIDTLIDWAIRSNYVSLLTDCPHREKLGWLEQLYLMGGSVHYNYDLFQTYNKQIDDMIAAQTPEGLVPDIAPEYVEFWEWFRDSPEWGSACIQVPYLMYKWYGDKKIIERSWNMMGRYAEYLRDTTVNQIVDHGLGDWYDLGPERPGIAQLTPRSLTGTAIYFSDVKLLSEMAEILGKSDEQQKYAFWADEIKVAFNQHFLNPETNIYSTGSQTAISMPLVLEIVDEKDKAAIYQTLVESIEKDNKALTAGDVGFHYLVKALQDNGGAQLLYEMNARDDVPGYGYQLKKGATALTESWAALPIVSNNHLMLGHLMEWFYSGLGGIDQTPNSIAFSQLKIAPQMVGNIDAAQTSFESPYGTVVVNWKKSASSVFAEVSVPCNSEALVTLPYHEGQVVHENGVSIDQVAGMTQITYTNNEVNFIIGSGNYQFKVK
ncbi:MAG: family 78 glycoside hydrolase catalytic domain [Prolixibacteraceae bacterium]